MRETTIMRLPIYLDYNGTTPHDPAVIEAMRPFLETAFGNPSSSHWYGEKPKQAVEKARQQVAGLINCRPSEVIFTSGGTEANNHAIIGMAQALKRKGRHIITSAFEHPAVFDVRLNGHPDHRLPNTASLAFKGLEANHILERIGSQVAASPGAACHSDTVSISHVLEAMQVPLKWAKGTVRFSVGRSTCVQEIDRATGVIVQAVNLLRSKP